MKILEEGKLYSIKNYDEFYNKFFKTENSHSKLINFITPYYIFKKERRNRLKEISFRNYGPKDISYFTFIDSKNNKEVSYKVFARNDIVEDFFSYFKSIEIVSEEFEI